MSTDKFKDKKFIDINGLTHFYDNLKETELSKYLINEDIILATDDDIINIYYANEYLTFEVINDSSFSFTSDGIQYSIDKINWNTLSANQSTPVFNSGTKVYWRGELTPNSDIGIGTFSSTGEFNVSGNPKYLLKDNKLVDYSFYKLFYNCTNLINAYELILDATTLTNYCYQYMFQGCTSLTAAPELPATTLASACYAYMFQGCTSLTEAPELPATTILGMSYNSMFRDCSKLNKVICYATTGMGGLNTQSWLSGVSDTGNFYKVKDATYSSGVSGIPSSWTIHNIEE